MGMMLVLSDISADTWSCKITGERQVLGRVETADIHLESRTVSRRHCQFWTEPDGSYVADCDSTNGTYLNGRKIRKHRIHSGDRIVVGKFELVVATENQVEPTDYELPASDTVLDQPTIDLSRERAVDESSSTSSSDERRLASAVHQRLTPSRRIGLPGMLVEVGYVPSGLLGGDCFECLEINDRWVLAIFDSMNHGTTAALAISLIRSELRRWLELTTEPGKCLARLNDELTQLQINDLYVCASLAVWSPMSGTFVYATAGQRPPYILRKQKILNYDETASGYPLGVRGGEQFHESLSLLQEGDRIFFFSDGVDDVLRRKGTSESTNDLIAEELERGASAPLQTQTQGILDAHAGQYLDDALIVGCEVGPQVEKRKPKSRTKTDPRSTADSA